MLNTKKNGKMHYKKIIVSIIFGLLGFWLNFHAVHFMQFADIKVSILFGLLFPAIITMFWGWKYGLLSALFGGCQSMWWLWSTDGYGVFYSVPIFTLWIIWHGFWADYRRAHDYKWYLNMYVVEIVFRLFSILGFYTVFRWLISLNPPLWAPQLNNNFVSYSWVNFVMVKHIITAYSLLLFCDVLMHIGPVRIFFLPKNKSNHKGTTYIISASMLMGLLFWVIYTAMDYFVFYKGKDTFLNLMSVNIPITSLFFRNFCLLIFLVIGVVLSRIYLRLQKKDIFIRENEKKYSKLIETTSEGFWLINTEKKIIEINQAFCDMFGYPKNEIIGKTLFDFVDDENRKIIEEQTSKITKTKHRNYEISLKKKNGDNFPTIFNATSIVDENGNPAGSFAFVKDISKQKKAEEQIKKDLKIQTSLLLEIYHRTKNNMAVVSAMLSMQSRRSDNDFVKTTFKEMINKIRSMSLVHEKLYKAKDLSSINLKEYIEDLTRNILQSYGKLSEKITFKFEMEEVNILIDSAIPLGLILNELISNIFNHAFTDNQKGEIFIKLHEVTDGLINIELHDNGVGFPKNFDPRIDGSMGLSTIFSLIEDQLKGEVTVKSENGLRWQIKLPISLNKKRV